jgi:sugar O-acyltransferase (sialic acid O-acetyltransferase NeuD family)
MSLPRCVIIGAGGHAKVLIESIGREGKIEAHCLIDQDSRCWKTELSGVPIVGGDDKLVALRSGGITSFAVGVGRSGRADRRRALFEMAMNTGFAPATVIDPTATVSEHAEIEAGAQILARAIVNPGARIGRNAVVNTAAIVEHDCDVGEHAFVGPGAVLAGGVSIGAGCFVGAGAVLLPGVAVGEGAVIGAGAVVLRPVAAGDTAVGVPAQTKGRAR